MKKVEMFPHTLGTSTLSFPEKKLGNSDSLQVLSFLWSPTSGVGGAGMLTGVVLLLSVGWRLWNRSVVSTRKENPCVWLNTGSPATALPMAS